MTALLRRIAAHFELHPACPICGRVYYVKTMPLHLAGHKPDDPDVVAWRARGAPARWTA